MVARFRGLEYQIPFTVGPNDSDRPSDQMADLIESINELARSHRLPLLDPYRIQSKWASVMTTLEFERWVVREIGQFLETLLVEEIQQDAVNHPSHYNQYKGFEVIDVCEQLGGPDGKSGFNLGNAFKYIARAGWKNPERRVEDLEKAAFYIQREIERLNQKKTDELHNQLQAEMTAYATPGKPQATYECIVCHLEIEGDEEQQFGMRVMCPHYHGPMDKKTKPMATIFRCPDCNSGLLTKIPGLADGVLMCPQTQQLYVLDTNSNRVESLKAAIVDENPPKSPKYRTKAQNNEEI